MGKKKKLKLEDIKVQSFVTSQKKSTTAGQEQEGITGNCLSFIGITCPDCVKTIFMFLKWVKNWLIISYIVHFPIYRRNKKKMLLEWGIYFFNFQFSDFSHSLALG